ncbi:Metabotropic glutamate receptor 1 [Holothuria leucospilota]|uniref:Metabotropic glutamate receptor 1 n=1 Tax=Holothuria leucospilota TaxID=206669 RepID=A0A9Q0YSA8_HOLLE|nr:Metabotropic glutamate receptor 1 [Holothuria leucospilota]
MLLDSTFPMPGSCLLLLMAVSFQGIYRGVFGVSATPVREVARIEGDLIIGALFSVHDKPPDDDKASRRQCGAIREQYGIQRVEVMLKTIRQINKDPNILPGVNLGCEIRDSCWFSSVALEQSLEFLSDSLSSIESSKQEATDDVPDACDAPSGPKKNPIVAVIGPGSSTVSIQVQNLLQLFNIPQIAYSATSKDLSDKSIYKTFLRVCPPDTMQAQAMVDIARRYNWTYVSAVYTEGNYGSSGFLAFKNLAHLDGICIASSEEISDTAADEEVDDVVRKLLETTTAKVVICFCQGETVRKLLNATKRMNIKNRFLFIGSDGWANRKEVTQDLEEFASGSITIKPHTKEYKQFNDYYFSLDPLNNTLNPWFKPFWEQKFNCRLSDEDNGDFQTASLQPCTGNESLDYQYQQDTKMGSVVNAIYVVANALDNMHRDLCGPNSSLCTAMDPVDGRVLLKYLYNVTFESESGELIKFDKKGDPTGRYDLYHFDRRWDDGTFDYLQIGEWFNGLLSINDSALVWKKRENYEVESYCSKPCSKGHKKNIRDNIQCCWACVPCGQRDYLKDEFTCEPCKEGYAPNAELTDCDLIEVEYMRWSDSQAILAIVIASVGLICTSFVIVTFIRYNGTPIIKASSRENSYILLIGITMCFALTFPYVSMPSIIVCYLQRICLGLSFCLCYSSLVVRTNRMARILAGSKKKILTRKPRFLSGTAQVVITVLIISVEIGIIVAFLIVEPPEAVTVYPTFNTARLICKSSTRAMVGPLGYDAFLVGMCTVYAFKTRNLPENFNEAKYIAFTMYTTCVVWLAFVPLYFGSGHMREIVVCFAVSLSAAVALACLFLPKTYIILFKPERNRRSSMTTSTLVRMHVGSFYDSSSRGFSSNNGTVDFSREKLLRTKSSNSRSSIGSGRSSLFASLRRRNNSVPAPRKMKALERDLNQRRRMPVYRYSSSSPQGTSPTATPKGRRPYVKWSVHRKKKDKTPTNANDIIQETSTSGQKLFDSPQASSNHTERKPPLSERRARSLEDDAILVSNGPVETVASGKDIDCKPRSPGSQGLSTISKSADNLENESNSQPNRTFVHNKFYNNGPNESPRIIINRAISSSFRNIPLSNASSVDQISQCSNPLQLTDNYLYSSSRENSISDQNSDVIVVDDEVTHNRGPMEESELKEVRKDKLRTADDGHIPVPRQDSLLPVEPEQESSDNQFVNEGTFDELLAMLVDLKSSDV